MLCQKVESNNFNGMSNGTIIRFVKAEKFVERGEDRVGKNV